MLIDTHCHFNSLSSKAKGEALSNGLDKHFIIDSSIEGKSSLASNELSKKYDFVYTSLGFHPFCVKDFNLEVLEGYEKLIDSNEKIVAVGEIGLDYKADEPLKNQEDIFRMFIKLAKKKELPIVIHNRLDDERVLNILDSLYQDYKQVVFHCFSYSTKFLEKILERKGFVSFSLNILRKNKDILESLKMCPIENILFETDSPYMCLKGSSTTPLDIDKVYAFAAQIKGIQQKSLEDKVIENVKKVFNIQ